MKEALKLFSIFAWDDTDKAAKDVIRYMGLPGQATAYTIGRAAIMKMRNETEKALGKDFDEKEFHYIILSQVRETRWWCVSISIKAYSTILSLNYFWKPPYYRPKIWFFTVLFLLIFVIYKHFTSTTHDVL